MTTLRELIPLTEVSAAEDTSRSVYCYYTGPDYSADLDTFDDHMYVFDKLPALVEKLLDDMARIVVGPTDYDDELQLHMKMVLKHPTVKLVQELLQFIEEHIHPEFAKRTRVWSTPLL